MSESANLPTNFGGIVEPNYSAFDFSRVLILPVSFGAAKSATDIISASINLELYEEETDAELYKIGIHTLTEFKSLETSEKVLDLLYDYSRELLKSDKFLCTIGGEHSISAPIIRAHAEKFHDISVLQIDSRANLHDEIEGNSHSPASVMGRVIKDLRIPSVQVGIRSISTDEAQMIDVGLPTKIFWAKDIVGRTNWIDNAVNSLTENVYLTIDVSAFDPSIMPTSKASEPGGLGWYEIVKLVRKLSKKCRIVGMDLVEYSHIENQNAPAFLCAKLIYKSLAYIFNEETRKVLGKNI